MRHKKVMSVLNVTRILEYLIWLSLGMKICLCLDCLIMRLRFRRNLSCFTLIWFFLACGSWLWLLYSLLVSFWHRLIWLLISIIILMNIRNILSYLIQLMRCFGQISWFSFSLLLKEMMVVLKMIEKKLLWVIWKGGLLLILHQIFRLIK